MEDSMQRLTILLEIIRKIEYKKIAYVTVVGHISQVIGPVVDVYFEGTEAELMLPSIHDALEIRKNHGKRLICGSTAAHW